ncbi:hypothetical protein FHR83_006784 [Actinoplanes campanulatus]|uniref:DUF6292 domain-containing protein n=1 Tax=Actinoplanes campanulatus TaxID=113559 RepID=A0A7W5AMM6_9ACTN|nr:DUF6292 family protein [Actinoplanes campanulatus]MBB3099078.1 hypothetical protein [Actinoplanes campanulatus]GGN39143.1 hypothetical protein GCM10010109_66740 [Actinoplanes campanulatus]GID40235.1 hypothetical protein Aca09nite_67410 [Actinoplanes campanulatus]
MSTDHGPYIAAVQEALIHAGFETLNEHAEDEDPRGGGIQLDPRSPAAADWFANWDEVWLGWNEDRGWALVCTEELAGGEPKTFTFDSHLPRLAAPVSVVRMACGHAGVSVQAIDALPEPAIPDADFPGHSFLDDDPVFEQALARYREPSCPRS